MLRNLKQSSKPVGVFEAFEQRSDMILSLYYCELKIVEKY